MAKNQTEPTVNEPVSQETTPAFIGLRVRLPKDTYDFLASIANDADMQLSDVIEVALATLTMVDPDAVGEIAREIKARKVDNTKAAFSAALRNGHKQS